jgi:ribose 5-phosphate isomerase A
VNERERIEGEKRAAAEAAARLVTDGMAVGLGTGSTVAYLLDALGRTRPSGPFVATSPATAERARALGLDVRDFDALTRLDLAIDGADQVDPEGWLVKGGGGAHVREKVVAAAADRFVVIVSSDKVVDRLAPPVPLEILGFGAAATLAEVAPAQWRAAPPTPDGNRLADFAGEVVDPAALARRFDTVAGVVGHGLFPPTLVHDVLVARGEEVEHRRRVP